MQTTQPIEAEPYPFELQKERCALLIIDMQRDFLEPDGFGEMLGGPSIPTRFYSLHGVALG